MLKPIQKSLTASVEDKAKALFFSLRKRTNVRKNPKFVKNLTIKNFLGKNCIQFSNCIILKIIIDNY